MINVTIYNEYVHEKVNPKVGAIYPNGIHTAIADFLKCDDINVRTVTLEDIETGLTQEVLDDTDVLLWWGHVRHGNVPDEIAARVRDSVFKGMGFIGLHSAHHSKPFKLLMGTTCNLSWRLDGDYERIWKINAGHPITQGIGRYFELEHEEIYAEPFSIPEPDELLFIGSYEGGEVIRAGCTYRRENGKIFYFQPGHEEYPTFYNENVQTIIRNAVRWAAPISKFQLVGCPNIKKIGTEE